ncbi:MAG: tRNA pseudouridine(38-40) synthase TruA [Bacteroidota bacterium]
MRYFIELSYNGKKYHGWQNQPNAISVQETLEKAFSVLLRQKIELMGCGRTDTGVHAAQFFAHFDINKSIDDNFLYKINSFLPKDIAIHHFFLVDDNAHARFDATSRSYEYRVNLGKNPFLLDTSWQIHSKMIDVSLMNEAAKELYNYTNFKSFSRSNTDVKTYECVISNALWIKEDDLLIFNITANRFLRNMVRAIVGTLMEVGLGKITIREFKKIIESKDRTKAGASAKAKGLFLTKITYPFDLITKNNFDAKGE